MGWLNNLLRVKQESYRLKPLFVMMSLFQTLVCLCDGVTVLRLEHIVSLKGLAMIFAGQENP